MEQTSSYTAYIPEVDAARTAPLVHRRRIPTQVRRAAAMAAMLILLLLTLILGWRTHQHHRLLAKLAQDRNPRQLFAAMQDGRITRDEAISIIRQSPRAQDRTRRIEDYFALPPGSARRQYLDKLIDGIAARRKQLEAKGPGPPAPSGSALASAGPGTGRMNPSSSRAAWFESVPPQQRAEFQQFRYDINQRMQQRGVASAR